MAAALEKNYLAARFCGDTNALSQVINAAENRNHLAEGYLSILYQRGCNGCSKDTNKSHLYAKYAISWLQSESSEGNKYALYLLGGCFKDGRGVGEDEREAVRLFKLVADQEHVLAQVNLGIFFWSYVYLSISILILTYFKALCYFNGTGVFKNQPEAVRVCTLAANQGSALAQCNLGELWFYLAIL